MRIEISGFKTFQFVRIMPRAFLKLPARCDDADLPIRKIRPQRTHLFIERFRFRLVSEPLALRRIAQQKSFIVRSRQVDKIRLYEIGARNAVVFSD